MAFLGAGDSDQFDNPFDTNVKNVRLTTPAPNDTNYMLPYATLGGGGASDEAVNQKKIAGAVYNRGTGITAPQQINYSPYAREVQSAQIDQSGVNAQLGQQGGQMAGANAAWQGQTALASDLARQASGQGGPSLAELAMARQADANARQSLALAAGGAGPSNAAGVIAAQNANAVAQGQLVRDTGIQRAAEQQAARAQLADVLGTSRGQSQAGAQIYGENAALAGQLATGQAGLQQQAGLANQASWQGLDQLNQQGAIANQNADLQAQQLGLVGRGQNDALTQFYEGNSLQLLENQAARDVQMDTNAGNWAIGQASNQVSQNSNTVNQQVANQQGLGGLLAMGGGALALLSDIRAKKDVEPAAPAVSDAFRNFGSYGYNYRDATDGEGRHYGGMAQELAATPAGRSAVVPTQRGLGIDTGRLAVMNASETGQLRREMDDLKESREGTKRARFGVANSFMSGRPDFGAIMDLRERNARDEATLARIKRAEETYQTGLSTRVPYPTTAAPYGY